MRRKHRRIFNDVYYPTRYRKPAKNTIYSPVIPLTGNLGNAHIF